MYKMLYKRLFHETSYIHNKEQACPYDGKINVAEDRKSFSVQVVDRQEAEKIIQDMAHANRSLQLDYGRFYGNEYQTEIRDSAVIVSGKDLIGALDLLFRSYYISAKYGKQMRIQIWGDDSDNEEIDEPVGTYFSSPVAVKKPVSALPQTNGHHSPPVEVGKKL